MSDLNSVCSSQDLWDELCSYFNMETLYQLSCVSKSINFLIWSALPALFFPEYSHTNKMTPKKTIFYLKKRLQNSSKPLRSLSLYHLSNEHLELIQNSFSQLTDLEINSYALPLNLNSHLSSLHHLTSLTILDLVKGATLPENSLSFLKFLTKLSSLNVSCAQLSTSDLPNSLQTLDISMYSKKNPPRTNQLNFKNLTNLQNVDFGDREVPPDKILTLPAHLTSLRFAPLARTDTHPFTRFQNLSSLDLNALTLPDRSISFVSSYTGLTSLKLRGARFIEDLSFLEPLKLLEELSIDTGAFTTLSPLISLPMLTKLHLSSPKRLLTREGFSHISHLTNLRILSLPGAEIADQWLDSLQSLCSLEDLDLIFCQSIDQGFSKLSRLPLKRLNLAETSLCGSLPQLPSSLLSLNISGTLITDSGLSSISSLNQLTELNINRCHCITDYSVFSSLKKLVNPPVTKQKRVKVTDASSHFVHSFSGEVSQSFRAQAPFVEETNPFLLESFPYVPSLQQPRQEAIFQALSLLFRDIDTISCFQNK